MISYFYTRKSNTPSTIVRSMRKILAVSSRSMMPCFTDYRIMVSFIIMYCLRFMLNRLHKSYYSFERCAERFYAFYIIRSFRNLLVLL